MIFIAIVATVFTGIVSAAGTWLAQLGCIGDATTAACGESEGGNVGPIEALLLLGPALLVACAGVVALRRREMRPVVVAVVVLAPLGFLLPPLAWG